MRVLTTRNSEASSLYLTSVPVSDFISKKTKKEPKIIKKIEVLQPTPFATIDQKIDRQI
jgi:hypothetical protein